MTIQQFTEVELRIMQISILKPNLLKYLLEIPIRDILYFQVNILAHVSDGIPDATFHTSLNTGQGIKFQDSNINMEKLHPELLKIRPGGLVRFDPTGLTVYRNKNGQMPQHLSCHLAVVENNENVRSEAELFERIRNNTKFIELSGIFATAMINPVIPLGLNIGAKVFDIALEEYKRTPDRHLLLANFDIGFPFHTEVKEAYPDSSVESITRKETDFKTAESRTVVTTKTKFTIKSDDAEVTFSLVTS